MYDRLLFWEANTDKVDTTLASFLLNDDVPNKEKLLRQKKEQKQNYLHQLSTGQYELTRVCDFTDYVYIHIKSIQIEK